MLRKLAAVASVVLVAASFAVASAMASDEPSRLSVAKRNQGVKPPPPVPPPDTPESPLPDTPSLPPDEPSPGPSVDSGPPPAPAEPPSPAAPPEVPPPPSPVPTPPSSPADDVGPSEGVRGPAGAPQDAPVRLPQTGSGTRPLTATGGWSLLAAGLAVIAGARHRAGVSQPARRR